MWKCARNIWEGSHMDCNSFGLLLIKGLGCHQGDTLFSSRGGHRTRRGDSLLSSGGWSQDKKRWQPPLFRGGHRTRSTNKNLVQNHISTPQMLMPRHSMCGRIIIVSVCNYANVIGPATSEHTCQASTACCGKPKGSTNLWAKMVLKQGSGNGFWRNTRIYL